METGKIVQVLGPVIDVAFEGKLPMIRDALTVVHDGKKCVMEVAQHMGNKIVRCISLSSTEDFARTWRSLRPDPAFRYRLEPQHWAECLTFWAIRSTRQAR